jgi:hypothetical protein
VTMVIQQKSSRKDTSSSAFEVRSLNISIQIKPELKR